MALSTGFWATNIVRLLMITSTFTRLTKQLQKGYVLYYTSQCPFNAKYIPVLEQTARENDIPFHAIHIESREKAQNAPTPITNYALFHDGEYITNEQMNEKKFLKLVNA